MTLVVITSIPSPYQVELFDALARQEPGFRAIYLSRRDRSRSWTDPLLQHDAVFLDEAAGAQDELFRLMDAAEFVVFSDYTSKPVRRAMRQREAVDKPWCFWGERPGYHGLGSLGAIWRRVRLAPLHRNRHVPIWGIGKWAIDAYRKEFGESRVYCNVPYFSDLERFRAASALRTKSGTVRILYSGSLIKRKGVDLFAKAFRRLDQAHDNVSLSVIGAGPLRANIERTLGLSRSRAFFHDFVGWSELPKFYAEGDVLCAPSRYDGWGLIVPEGMAAGLPVIATDRMGSALELVEHRQNGWRVRANSEDHLYEALCEAVEISPSRRESMGLAAQSRALQQDISIGVQRFRKATEDTLAVWRQSTARALFPAK